MRDLMPRELLTGAATRPPAHALEVFLTHPISGRPVIEGSRAVGIVTGTDALRVLRARLVRGGPGGAPSPADLPRNATAVPSVPARGSSGADAAASPG